MGSLTRYQGAVAELTAREYNEDTAGWEDSSGSFVKEGWESDLVVGTPASQMGVLGCESWFSACLRLPAGADGQWLKQQVWASGE